MIEVVATSDAKWLWDEYGKTITEKALQGLRGKWSKFKWSHAESRYRSRLRKIYSTTRLLGNPKPIAIEEMFTDVYILQELQEQSIDKTDFHLEYIRKPILNLVRTSSRLFILGRTFAYAGKKA